MKTTIRLSQRNVRGVWIVFTIIFLCWLGLLLTSDVPVRALWQSLLLLGLACFGMPIIGTFFVYVTIDETHLTVPMAAVLRRSIPIEDIHELALRRHGLGFLKG